MIHWTIYPLEFMESQFSPEMKVHLEEMEIDGVKVQILLQENGEAQIFRVLSTNPQDYLRPDLQPGTILSLGLSS